MKKDLSQANRLIQECYSTKNPYLDLEFVYSLSQIGLMELTYKVHKTPIEITK